VSSRENMQRRKPAQRLFHGPAGSYLTYVDPSAPEQAKPPLQVKIHTCFDQSTGERKPDRCACKESMDFDDAQGLVKAGRAYWFLRPNSKTHVLEEYRHSVVMHREIVFGEVLFAINPNEAKKEARRKAKHDAKANEIRDAARKLFGGLVSKGKIPPEFANQSDNDLEQLFTNEPSAKTITAMLVAQGLDFVSKRFEKIVLRWWNEILGYQKLGVIVCELADELDHGKGLIITHPSSKIEQISAHRDMRVYDDAVFEEDENGERVPVDERTSIDPLVNLQQVGRVRVANHRPSELGGRLDYGEGQNPSLDADEEKEDEIYDRQSDTEEPED
jgi:hypothetical protein